MLEIRRNRFAKPYENEFFRIFAKKLSKEFEKLNINGVLLGSPVCIKKQDLQIDALLITESGIVIIDLKNYSGIIKLPNSKQEFENEPWFNITKANKTIIIKGGGSNKNPYKQVWRQKEIFDVLIKKEITPKLTTDENIESKDTYPVICFQQEIVLQGEIPDNLQRIFHIASPSTFVKKLTDLLYVAPNEWKGSIKGYKLNQNTFDNLKTLFKADAYNPFEDLSMFEEFEKIDFSDYVEEALFVEQQFENNKEVIDRFFNTETNILQIDCDSTPTKLSFVSKLVSYYYEQKNNSEKENGNTFYLAPTNKHVADLTRDGAGFQLQSLYSKLYDFENTTIELMDNSINEREIFPLLENNDTEESLYIIFNAHLVYHFESNSDDLVKFGSGSLCKDTLTYINSKERKNKIILLNDKYFYGFRAQTICDRKILEEDNYTNSTIVLGVNPLTANQKTIASIEKNLNLEVYNKLYWDGNPNIQTLKNDEFKELLNSRILNNQLHKTHILTREKYDSETTNSWVRKILNNSGKVNKGDVVWIKNKVMLPEITDPFSIPKFALSGDMGEITEIVKRFTFKSDKYKFRPIEISFCKIKLHDYDSIKDIYLYDYSINDMEKINTSENIKIEIKQHIQVRLRELVNSYLLTNNIDVKDVLQPNDFDLFSKELKNLESKNLFDDKSLFEKDVNKLIAKWKINKRKETYARVELLKDIKSEYFILNQFAFYEFGWSLPVKNSYGYLFDDSFLIEYVSPEQNAERVHEYLYSALSCSHNLYLHNLLEFSPLIGLGFSNIPIPDEANKNKSNAILFKFTEGYENEFTDQIKEKYQLENKPISLIKFSEFILNKISSNEKIKLIKIEHFNFQERYHFEIESKSQIINFSYNNKHEFKITSNQIINQEILQLLIVDSNDVVAFNFIDDNSWQSKSFIKIQETLLKNGAFIFDFEHKDWLFDFKVMFDSEESRLQFNYNGDGFITRLNVVNTTNKESTEKVIEFLKELVL
jgi:hypothetical protein